MQESSGGGGGGGAQVGGRARKGEGQNGDKQAKKETNKGLNLALIG